MEVVSLVLGLITGLALIPIAAFVFHWLTLEVEDDNAVIITRFGKAFKTITKPGLHLWVQKILPWFEAYSVSLKRDFRLYEKIHVNDCRGTTIIIDLWVEYRILSPEKILFQVENWEKSLQSILTCSATSILGTYEFSQILSNRNELGRTLKEEIKIETERWGLELEHVFISRLSLLPDVSQQLFDAVAARLEKAKADIEEAGRLETQLLEAETSSKVAVLEAEAKGQYSLSISHAYSELAQKNPQILEAYIKLHQLSLTKPHRVVAFQGFNDREASAMEAAMSMPAILEPNSASNTNSLFSRN